MSETLIKVEGVSKKFCRSLKKSLFYGVQDLGREVTGRRHGGNGELRADEFWALKDVSFELKRGECLGLIGHNGAGKTTLLRMLNGLIKPDSGRIEMRGRIGALIALGAGFNPILSGRENIYVNASVLGLTNKDIAAKIDEIIDFAEIREFIDMPVQSYSSGMQVRLGFAVASSFQPDILILDEVLAVGDFSFHAKCFKRIGSISRNSAVIFVSHDQSSVGRICDRTILIERGRCAYIGNTIDALRQYNNAYKATLSVKSTTVCHDDIVFTSILFNCGSRSITLQTSDALNLVIQLETKKSIPIGKCLVSFYSETTVNAGQADFTGQLDHLPEGFISLKLEIPRIQLAAGMYTMNIAIFHANGRDTVLHSISCTEIEVIGLSFLGSHYKIPVKVKLSNSLSRNIANIL